MRTNKTMIVLMLQAGLAAPISRAGVDWGRGSNASNQIQPLAGGGDTRWSWF